MLTLGGEGGSTKVKMLTVVDGKRRGRVESKNLKVLLPKLGGGGRVEENKIVDGC